MKIGMIARTLFSRFLLVLLGIIFLIPMVIFMCIPKYKRYHSKIIFWITHWFYVAVLKCSLLPIKFIGVNNIPDDEPVIFASNHQSSLDIPLVGVLTKKV